jgi:polysaccharide export outer membrane protein
LPSASGDTAGSKPPAAVNRGAPDDYVIGEGDVLQINVWKELDVPNVQVRTDGRITMPLIKDVSVAGLTLPQAEKLITDQLSNLINMPDVTVILASMHSKRIYFIGQVKTQAPIAYAYRMTVMQAISEAGGLTDYAKRKKIYVIRSENGRQYKLPFDYDAVLKGQHMELNIPLLPGDTVVVP